MMAKENQDKGPPPPREPTSEADKAKARRWFEKANTLRNQKNYDYAIESYISGLAFWPDAVEDGLMPLWSLIVQRQAAGGKKPGMMDVMRLQMLSAKEPADSTWKSLTLFSKDPDAAAAVDAVIKFGTKAGFIELVLWASEKALESLRKDKKASHARFRTFRETMVEAAQKADAMGDTRSPTGLYEAAVKSLELQMSRYPNDMALKDEQRDIGGKLTIAKGKYSEAGDFRESLVDAAGQKVMHDAHRTQQSEDTLDSVIRSARREYEAAPDNPLKVTAYVEALKKREHADTENEAIRVLTQAAVELDNYSFKSQADEIRLRQLARQTRQLQEQAAKSGSEEDAQQLRLARMEESAVKIEVYRERVANYPTEQKHKIQLGETLFKMGDPDEAIPLLQAAQADPRHRFYCQSLIGQCFFAKELYGQAADVLEEALAAYDRGGDDLGKTMMYWRGRALEADGRVDEAKAAYGQLVRTDYGYMDGDARKRLDALSKK